MATGTLRTLGALPILVAIFAGLSPRMANADQDNTLILNNTRLNDAVYSNIYTAQQQNGCLTEIRRDSRLTEAARRHTLDVRDHPGVDGDIGSDGSSIQDRANAAGYHGTVTETVAINPALAISGIEILNQWWGDPVAQATMQDCHNTAVGVWSETSPGRSVVVAVYGQPVTR